MAKKSKFKRGRSGSPATMFKPGNEYRWQPGQSGNPSGLAKRRLQYEQEFYDALLNQGSAAEAAALVIECARDREPWAIQLLLQRLAPPTEHIRVTHDDDEASQIDYTQLSNEDLEQLEKILARARRAPQTLIDSTGTPQRIIESGSKRAE